MVCSLLLYIPCMQILFYIKNAFAPSPRHAHTMDVNSPSSHDILGAIVLLYREANKDI